VLQETSVTPVHRERRGSSRNRPAIWPTARKTPFTALAIALFVTVLAVGAAPANAAAAAPKRGGTLTVGTEIDPASLDPIKTSAYVGQLYTRAVFDTLLDIDTAGRIVPGLAESYAMTTDGLRYTLKLRRGVKFHDGGEFNADAVVFNLDRARDPANGCRCLPNMTLIQEVKALDALTVEIRLKAPMASLPAVLTDGPGMMASPKAVRAAGETFGQRPVGTGPFRFAEWTKGSRFVVERNPEYWQPDKPLLDKVVFKGLQNSETREATLRAGGFDVITTAPPRFVMQSRNDPRWQVLVPNGFGSFFIPLRMTHPDLKDPRVRLALAHATNREQLIKVVYHGMEAVATTPFGRGQFMAPDEVAAYPKFDPERAKALLAEYGKPVTLTLTANINPTSMRAMQVLQQMWRKVGITAEIQTVDSARLIQNVVNHEFDALVFRWQGRPDPDLNVYSFFHSSLARRKPSANYVQYASEEMDRLLEDGRRELNPVERRRIYGRVAELLARDLPYIFIGYVTAPLVASKRVGGLLMYPDSILRVGDLWLE
jgi:peptide/nickel transport system substrate-binding protein